MVKIEKCRCTSCKKEQDVSQFKNRNPRRNNHKQCLTCRTKNRVKAKRQRDKTKPSRHNEAFRAKARVYKRRWYKKNQEERPEAFEIEERERRKRWLASEGWKATKERLKVSHKRRLIDTKSNARKRDLEYTISDDDAIIMFHDPCFYCGNNDDKSLRGIDRVDNDEGYVLENCVPCCIACNSAKRNYDVLDFIKMSGHIASKTNLADNIVDFPELFPDRVSGTYKEYQQNSKTRKTPREFRLSVAQFNSIVGMSCYYCDKKPSKTHRNGIDRNDNDEGYLYDNCLPCCATCNFLKHETKDAIVFIERCAAVWNRCNYMIQ